MFLSKQEIEVLTGRTRRDAQIRILRFMGIEHRVRPDGSVAVSRAHVECVMGGTIAVTNNSKHKQEPNWETF